MKPKKRSALRLQLGYLYYSWRRYLHWFLNRHKLTHTRNDGLLKHAVFSHCTPLYRQLRNVDMWLQENKVHNLKLAVQKLDRIILQPGQTLSYWEEIGNPTKKKGYLDGMILFYGRFKPGVGGGLCQLSNFIYWMTLHTPLTVTERHRHSYDVFPDSSRTQPFGSGATCSYPHIDLQIHNPTEHPFQLTLHVAEEYLEGAWRSDSAPVHTYEIYEKEHLIKLEHWGGYTRHNLIYRRTKNANGEIVNDAYITENHAIMMYAPLLEEGKA